MVIEAFTFFKEAFLLDGEKENYKLNLKFLRILISFALLSLGSLFVTYWFILGWATCINLGAMALIIGLRWRMDRRIRVNILLYSRILNAIIALNIVTFICLSGGIDSRSISWLIIVPIASLLLDKPVNCLKFWLFPTLIFFIFLLILSSNDFKFSSCLLEGRDYLFKVVTNIGLTIVIFFYGIAISLYKRMMLLSQIETNTQLEETQKELIKIQKQKDNFFASMSHEIRNPLTAIKGIIDLLQNSKTPPQGKEYDHLLVVLGYSSAHLLAIINDILDFSKIESGKVTISKKPIDPVKFVKIAFEMNKIAATEKNLSYHLDVNSDIEHLVLGDEHRITQIMVNLIGNAVKFTNQGFIKVDISFVKDEEIANQANIIVKVIDSGIGIEESALTRIFDGYSQANQNIAERFGGTGLGLSISRNLARLMGGNISIQSVVNIGSTFTLNIPFEITDQDITHEVITEKEVKLQNLKILVVDDNDINLFVAKKNLEIRIENAVVDTASDGKMAISKIIKNDYDMILMDMQMPEMNGVAATKFIRTELAKPKNMVPIIAMSANVGEDSYNECIEAGMNDYLYKPFDVNVLLKIIHNNLRQK
jgi:signal transduction histidine kinase/CheY-like chemotaxis protein